MENFKHSGISLPSLSVPWGLISKPTYRSSSLRRQHYLKKNNYLLSTNFLFIRKESIKVYTYANNFCNAGGNSLIFYKFHKIYFCNNKKKITLIKLGILVDQTVIVDC